MTPEGLKGRISDGSGSSVPGERASATCDYGEQRKGQDGVHSVSV